MSQDDQNDDQYEVMFTQGDYSTNSKLRGFDKSRGKQKKYMTQSSMNRMEELGLSPDGPMICFLCLEKNHISSRCPNYPNQSLSSVLCRVDNEPHGYHRAEQCKHRQQHSTLYVTDDY